VHRLDELRRQRALLQEHLTWLDREIEAEGNGAAASAALPPALEAIGTSAPPVPSSSAVEAAAPTTTVEVDAILADYRTPASKLQQDVRLGCFMYFAAALVAVAAGVVALYFLLRHR